MLTYLIKNLLPFVTEEENIVHVDKEAQSFEDRNTKYDQELPIESKHTAKDDNICHFLQINVQRDCYHLNLYKTAKLHDQGKIEYHNVRKLKSTTFEFDAIGKMMKRLRQYTHDEQQKYHCISSELHRLDTKIYENDLRYGLKNYVKNILRFDSNIHTQSICISNCCTIAITSHTFLEKLLKPILRELVETMSMFIIQA
ncbi:hypothetical protein BDF21DRAFT_176602 [Thamnidium elegans]|nr:hypothetical protein BDF21DRAFT_176602 [Thamnidium elegans]